MLWSIIKLRWLILLETLPWTCSRSENMNHPRMLSQRGCGPNMRDKDRGSPRTRDIDSTQKHTSRKASVKRCSPSVFALLEQACSFRLLKSQGEVFSAIIRETWIEYCTVTPSILLKQSEWNELVYRWHFVQLRWTNLNEWMHTSSFNTCMSGGVVHVNSTRQFFGNFSKSF